MNIVLVVTDTRGKSLVFTMNTLKSYSANEAAKLVEKNKLRGVHIVHTGAGSYLRANQSTLKEDNLDVLSVSSYKLFAALDNLNIALPLPGFKLYWKHYQTYLKSREDDGEQIILIDDRSRTTVEHVTEKLAPHRKRVFDAADHFSIDPYLLGAIIIDEISRASMLEGISDVLLASFVGRNSSAGIAQVTMETARGLIKQGYYNPDPRDKKLSEEHIDKTPRSHLYTYVVQPKHCIFFAAAKIRSLIDEWKPKADLTKMPEIIATLYHLPYVKPNANPEPNDRGLQIVKEFYPLAEKIFGAA